MSASPVPRDATSVHELLGPLKPYLETTGVTELCVNRPGELHVEREGGWTRHVIDELTDRWSYALAVAVASFAAQPLSRDDPFLSARLPGGERLQAVIPPACAEGHVLLSIRLPARSSPSLCDFESQGAFGKVASGDVGLAQSDQRLIALLRANQIRSFLEEAVRERKNIAIVGDTGSGKTTLMRALCALIGDDERVVTVEDTHELDRLHPNSANLFYNDALGIAPSTCIRAALRLRPDRVILAELRGPEAFDFINVLMTGHAGSITSFHAESCDLALQRLAIMAGAHDAARGYSESRLVRLAILTIDVIAHLRRTPAGRRMSGVHFDPAARLGLAGDLRDSRQGGRPQHQWGK